MGWMHVLTIVDNIRKSMMPPPKWTVGKVGEGKYGGTSGRGYVLAVVVGCCVGLHWKIGED